MRGQTPVEQGVFHYVRVLLSGTAGLFSLVPGVSLLHFHSSKGQLPVLSKDEGGFSPIFP